MGRLIDADKVIKDMQYYHDDCAQTSEYTRLGFETAIEVVKSATPVEAIPKDQYEARLKADRVAMFTELLFEIEELDNPLDYDFEGYNQCAVDCEKLIRQKIDALKEQTDDNEDC